MYLEGCDMGFTFLKGTEYQERRPARMDVNMILVCEKSTLIQASSSLLREIAIYETVICFLSLFCNSRKFLITPLKRARVDKLCIDFFLFQSQK
ncbi:hypothetical protein HA466_0058740 [Hirschfeldia incana]|nr:hypothetical protein HA466_0058740 [Hirschfeldia incana]KAJ0259533.1 hypothetical protein HA466_0058740 [Hirschfeldia incana]